MARSLVIVESPAKARTIGKLLGSAYHVEASIGHVRDLPRKAAEIPESLKGEPWARLGVRINKDFEPLYIVPAEKKAQIKKLKELLADANALYLATDEDREGESISWHLLEVLKPRVPVKRLVFHEITAPAINNALSHPRAVDLNLVRAQETRRVLDRLYGYEVSPLLWRKVGPGLSAGRVQSVAVRLVVDRERARLAFKSAGWWDVSGPFQAKDGSFDAELVSWRDSRVASGRDFDDATGALKASANVICLDEAAAREIAATLSKGPARVEKVEEKPYRDSPSPPFTTSTLQQESNRKLRWSARKTMQVAQQLYENGWITYMRTDSTTLSDEAITAARSLIVASFGSAYLPNAPRVYKSKVKNAQEAHEAIRPAGARFRGLEDADRELDRDAYRLYELIWKRTVACQMADATGEHISATVRAGAGLFQARGKTIRFPGYRRAYVEGADNPEAELADQERLLPAMKAGDALVTGQLEAKGHTTQPPARLTEATLVKELEARGIGRPSTYASIIDTILERDYVFKKATALVPTFTAFAVTQLLETRLGWLVDYDFTARMEEELDDVALGQRDATGYLRGFYAGDAGLKNSLEHAGENVDPREVCTIPVGIAADGAAIVVRVGKFGPYLSAGEDRADIPADMAPDELTMEKALDLLKTRKEGPRALGVDPRTSQPVFLMNGRFGPYIQLGEATEGAKPPRASLLKGMTEATLDLGTALALLSLPRELGVDPNTGDAVIATNGRFGAYLKAGDRTRSLPDERSVLSIALPEALELLAQPSNRRRGPAALRELGVDATTGRAVKLMEGRFGPYVTDGETNATLPKDVAADGLDLLSAVALIRVREGMPKKPGRGRRGARAAAKTTAAPKSAKTAKAAAAPKAAKAAKAEATPATKAKKATAKAPKAAAKDSPVIKAPKGSKAGEAAAPAEAAPAKKATAKKAPAKKAPAKKAAT